MPSSPEIRGVGGEIGKVKIDSDVESQKLGDASRDIRVSREVAIDLYRVGIDADQSFCSSPGPVGGEECVDHRGDIVGNIDLLKKAPRNQPDPFPILVRGNHTRLADLRQQARGSLDGSRQQEREETDEESKIEEIVLGFQVAFIELNDVGHLLEREERNA